MNIHTAERAVLGMLLALITIVTVLTLSSVRDLDTTHQIKAPATSQPDSSTATTTQRGEPYGGCDEAWQAPDSEGAQWCRDHGYL